MSERGEQKTKRLIIYKTHTISYDHLCLKEENKNQKGFCSPLSDIVFLVFVLLLQT
jgi:hypothetical protein